MLFSYFISNFSGMFYSSWTDDEELLVILFSSSLIVIISSALISFCIFYISLVSGANLTEARYWFSPLLVIEFLWTGRLFFYSVNFHNRFNSNSFSFPSNMFNYRWWLRPSVILDVLRLNEHDFYENFGMVVCRTRNIKFKNVCW